VAEPASAERLAGGSAFTANIAAVSTRDETRRIATGVNGKDKETEARMRQLRSIK
jgi:hypothetical protein